MPGCAITDRAAECPGCIITRDRVITDTRPSAKLASETSGLPGATSMPAHMCEITFTGYADATLRARSEKMLGPGVILR